MKSSEEQSMSGFLLGLLWTSVQLQQCGNVILNFVLSPTNKYMILEVRDLEWGSIKRIEPL